MTRPVAFYWQSYTNAAGTQPGQAGHDRAVRVGGAGDRQPRDLVAVDSRDRLLPGLVADPPGLAGGRGRCSASRPAG